MTHIRDLTERLRQIDAIDLPVALEATFAGRSSLPDGRLGERPSAVMLEVWKLWPESDRGRFRRAIDVLIARLVDMAAETRAEMLDFVQEAGIDDIDHLARMVERFTAAANDDRAMVIKTLIALGWTRDESYWRGELERLGPDYGAMLFSGLLGSDVSSAARHLPEFVRDHATATRLGRYLHVLAARHGEFWVQGLLRASWDRLDPSVTSGIQEVWPAAADVWPRYESSTLLEPESWRREVEIISRGPLVTKAAWHVVTLRFDFGSSEIDEDAIAVALVRSIRGRDFPTRLRDGRFAVLLRGLQERFVEGFVRRMGNRLLEVCRPEDSRHTPSRRVRFGHAALEPASGRAVEEILDDCSHEKPMMLEAESTTNSVQTLEALGSTAAAKLRRIEVMAAEIIAELDEDPQAVHLEAARAMRVLTVVLRKSLTESRVEKRPIAAGRSGAATSTQTARAFTGQLMSILDRWMRQAQAGQDLEQDA